MRKHLTFKNLILSIVLPLTLVIGCGWKKKKHVVYQDNVLNVETDEITRAAFGKEVYTPYQVMMWYLKTAESFSPTPYPDGEYPSIAFGYNFQHGRVGNQTWASGTKLLLATVEKIQKNLRKQKRFQHLDEWQIVALTCRFYNRGEGSLPKFDPEYLLGCCNTKQKGCTTCMFTCKDKKRQKKIREAHNARRKFEYNLYYHRFDLLDITKIKEKCITLELKHKNG